MHYRESLLGELSALVKGRHALLTGAEPRCVVIAGNAARELTDEFSQGLLRRIRERLFGVTVVTFDELLIELLERAER